MNDFNFLNTLQGKFFLPAQQVSFEFSSQKVGFGEAVHGFVKSSLAESDQDAQILSYRGVFFHELMHYYQYATTPVGLVLRLSALVKIIFSLMQLKQNNFRIYPTTSISFPKNDFNQNYSLLRHNLTSFQKLLFGHREARTWSNTEAQAQRAEFINVLDQLSIQLPEYLDFFSETKRLGGFSSVEERDLYPAIPDLPGSSLTLTNLFEGWAACVQATEPIQRALESCLESEESLQKLLKETFHHQYGVCLACVSYSLYGRDFLELPLEQISICVTLTKIACELALTSPMHPNLLASGNYSHRWKDLHPSWRFLGVVKCLDDLDLNGLEYFEQSYEKICTEVCGRNHWALPARFVEDFPKLNRWSKAGGDLTKLAVGQEQLILAYSSMMEAKKIHGPAILALYPYSSELLSNMGKADSLRPLLPPAVFFTDREFIDDETFVTLFFQNMFIDFDNHLHAGQAYDPMGRILDFFGTTPKNSKNLKLAEQLSQGIEQIFNQILENPNETRDH